MNQIIYYNEREVSEITGLTQASLRSRRRRKRKPVCLKKDGKFLYKKEDIDNYLKNNPKNTSSKISEHFISVQEAARILDISVDCLAKWKIKGKGPQHYKEEGIKYHVYSQRDVLNYKELRDLKKKDQNLNSISSSFSKIQKILLRLEVKMTDILKGSLNGRS